MSPLDVPIGIICGAGIVVLLSHGWLVSWLDKEVFIDVPASEANEQNERQIIREATYRPTEEECRSAYGEQPSMN